MRQSVQRDIVLATIALGRSEAGRFFCVAWGTTARLCLTRGDCTALVLQCRRHWGGVVPSPADFCTAVPAALCSGRAAEVASA